MTFRHAGPLPGQVVNALLILFSLLVSMVMWGFTSYHVYLVCTGFTTKESIKGRKAGVGGLRVLDRVCCCCSEASQIDPRRLVLQPSRTPNSWSVPIVSAEAFL